MASVRRLTALVLVVSLACALGNPGPAHAQALEDDAERRIEIDLQRAALEAQLAEAAPGGAIAVTAAGGVLAVLSLATAFIAWFVHQQVLASARISEDVCGVLSRSTGGTGMGCARSVDETGLHATLVTAGVAMVPALVMIAAGATDLSARVRRRRDLRERLELLDHPLRAPRVE